MTVNMSVPGGAGGLAGCRAEEVHEEVEESIQQGEEGLSEGPVSRG